MIKNLLGSKKAQVSSLVLIFFFLAVSLVAVTAENVTDVFTETDMEIIEETIEEIIEETVEEIPEEEVLVEDPVDPTNETPEEVDSLAENETVLPTLNETEEVFDTNQTQESNETIELNEAVVENETEQITNEDLESNQDGGSSGETETVPYSNLKIEIVSEEKITRGEEIDYLATVINNGNILVNNVFAEWQLPSEFEIVSGNESKDCGNLDIGERCDLTLIVGTSVLTQKGLNEIKLAVSYNE